MGKVVFVLLAGGLGRRFGGKVPKQFLKIAGKELIYASLERLERDGSWIDEVIVVLPQKYLGVKKAQILRDFPKRFTNKIRFTAGERTRFGSLKNALKCLWTPAFAGVTGRGVSPRPVIYIFVHDAARPRWDAKRALAMLKRLKARPRASGVVPVIAVRETIKRVNHRIKTLSHRETLFTSQTPQLVRLGDFQRALKKAGQNRDFLDESQVLEIAGLKVLPFKGDAFNIKITHPSDQQFLQT